MWRPTTWSGFTASKSSEFYCDSSDKFDISTITMQFLIVLIVCIIASASAFAPRSVARPSRVLVSPLQSSIKSSRFFLYIWLYFATDCCCRHLKWSSTVAEALSDFYGFFCIFIFNYCRRWRRNHLWRSLSFLPPYYLSWHPWLPWRLKALAE